MDTTLNRLRTWLTKTRVFASPQSKRRFLIHIFVLGFVFAIATIFIHRQFSFLTDAQALREFIRGYGILAPGALIMFQALQVVAAPIPGQVLAVVAGYLFGVWWGTLYNMIGITIGSTIAFWISRRYGRAYVETIIHEETLARFDTISTDHGHPALFFFFLIPGLPDDIICFVGGLTNIPLWQLIILAVIGRTPAFFFVNVVGDLLGTDQIPTAIVLAVILVVISVAGYRNRDLIVRLLEDNS